MAHFVPFKNVNGEFEYMFHNRVDLKTVPDLGYRFMRSLTAA